MKLYAQVGFGLGDKVNQGLSEGLIDGAIFSPKDLQLSTMMDRITAVRRDYPAADVFIDPQFYTSIHAGSPNISLGKLPEWDFFREYRKGELEVARNARVVIERCFDQVAQMGVTGLISPNILVSQSLDSREAVIAKNFLREAAEVHAARGGNLPLYASLVVCREALQDRAEFEEFINDITMLDQALSGIYLIVAGRASDARSDFFHTDVLANWMLLNLSLSVNGIRVINGYSDVISPFLGVAGGIAGATGWWSNLRMFSIGRFFPAGGGRQPRIRYLSKALLNRLLSNEKQALEGFVPEIVNGLAHDADYSPEPERADEVLQTWEALRDLNSELVSEDMMTGLGNCRQAVERARQAYASIAAAGLPLDASSRDDHLDAMEGALEQFATRAELG